MRRGLNVSQMPALSVATTGKVINTINQFMFSPFLVNGEQ
jgi:hypothetical protein